ncbi:hypothetical protein TNCV_3391061 [Trichonephila clavipes]|nr:hypothetical protein TNCV_3391061 [Trichonephila clavipes]
MVHDGALAYFCTPVRYKLCMAYPGHWVGRAGPVLWLPRSPDHDHQISHRHIFALHLKIGVWRRIDYFLSTPSEESVCAEFGCYFWDTLSQVPLQGGRAELTLSTPGFDPWTCGADARYTTTQPLGFRARVLQKERLQNSSQNVVDVQLCCKCASNDDQRSPAVKRNGTLDHNSWLWACVACRIGTQP